MIRNRARAGFHPSGRLNTGSRLESNLGSGVLLLFLFEKKKNTLIAGYLERICVMLMFRI